MYEKVVNYYEEKLCLDNMFFRRYYKRWAIGIIVVTMLMVLTNYLISLILDNLWIRTIVNFLINILIATIFLILIYVRNLMKIYREKVKTKVKIDTIGILMKQDRLSEYRKVEIKEMETFLKRECKIKDLKSIDMIIEEIDEEIKSKYENKKFSANIKLLIPVNKKENLLELKRVLLDIKIKWNGDI